MQGNVVIFILVLLCSAKRTNSFISSSHDLRLCRATATKREPREISKSTYFQANYYMSKFALLSQNEDTLSTSNLKIVEEGEVQDQVSASATEQSARVLMADSTNSIYRRAIKQTMIWVALAGIFGFGLWTFVDSATAEEFYAGYLVEQSLSVDNLFVFLLLFDFFKVPLQYQDKVLNWGIYGAVVMRATMITLGAIAIETCRPILLVFAGILVYSSFKILFEGDEEEEEDMSENAIVKFSKRLIDSTDEFDESNFFTIVDGARKATPLFLCMIAIEISDVVFAVDSIPAVFGVTENPLVVFTSNMFAIMGLRSLYTILSKAASDLVYLEPAVAVVLGFIGAKMIGEFFGYEIPTQVALTVVATLLSSGIGASILERRRKEEQDL
mmetsp:Transcript_11201/g.17322  ORF Transcript_11201/g.17322 Transcript_11201/m.17322 type:complete len:385 (+) Transcript_11201:131-1285(+)